MIVRTGKDPNTLSKFMQKISSSYAYQINRKYQRVGHIFQGRFNANYLQYKKDLKRAIAYVRGNPVVDGIVKKPSAYPWNGKI